MEYYITSPKDYWIAPNAVNISLNALGDKNRIQGSVSSGAVIMCFVESIKAESSGGEQGNGDGLWYGANHEPKRWPISLSPTYFNSNTHKYVYVAIPRSTTVGTQAVIVFPSEQLDIYGRVPTVPDASPSGSSSYDPTVPDASPSGSSSSSSSTDITYKQIGSTDYFYVYLGGIISAVYTDGSVEKRSWESAITDWGSLETAQGRDEKQSESEWYRYIPSTQTVNFLKKIFMEAGSWFQNLIIGDGSAAGELTGVAKDGVTTEESGWDSHIVTPAYMDEFGNTRYLRKDTDDETDYHLQIKGGVGIGSDNMGIDEHGDAVLHDVSANDIDARNVTVAQLIANLLKTPDFQSVVGMIGLGFGVTTDNNGKATLQTDDLIVVGRMIVNSLNIREVTYIGGTYLLTPAGSTVESVIPLYSSNPIDTRTWATSGSGNPVGYRLLWKADDGNTGTMNYWQQGDMAFCQTFNITEPGEYDNATNHYWWRLICRIGQTTINNRDYHYADVSDTLYVNLYDGNDNIIHTAAGSETFIGKGDGRPGTGNRYTEPESGDKAVMLGSQRDTNRQAAIQLTAEGTGSIGIYDNINDYKPLTNYEIHYFSKEEVRMNARKFMWNTNVGQPIPPTIYCGEWVTGAVSYYGDEWKYNGHTWLCIIPDGTTSEAPGTTPANWVSNKGEKGDPGDPGAGGENGNTPIQLFKWSQTPLTASDKPNVDEDGWATQEPYSGWYKHAQNRPSGNNYILYMSQNTLTGDGTIDSTAWSTPVQISGTDGKPGEDGKEREWIYRLDSNAGYNSTTGTIGGDSTKPVSGQTGGIDNCRLVDDFVPANWSDNPSTISKDHPTEYASFRIYDHENNRWGAYQTPIIWSHWGRNGMDGDGTEYVFMRTATNIPPSFDVNDGAAADAHKVDEWLPYINNSAACGAESSRCTDDPQGTTSALPFEWVAKRTMSAADANTGAREWKSYYESTAKGSGTSETHEMSLWSNYAESALVIDIDNEVDQFGTDSNGVVTPAPQVRTTEISMYFGSTAQVLNADNAQTPGVQASLFYEDDTAVPTEVAQVTKCQRSATDTTKGEVDVTIKAGTFPSAHSGIYALITGSCVRGSRNVAFTIQQVKSGAHGVAPDLCNLRPTVNSINFSKSEQKATTPVAKTIGCGYTLVSPSGTTNVATAESVTVNGTTYYIYWRYIGGTYAKFTTSSSIYATGILPSTTNTGVEFCLSSADIDNGGTITAANTLDYEKVPILKDGTDGSNSVRLALDNEHEDYLYSKDGLVSPSGGATSQAHLYDGPTDKTTDVTEWRISDDNGSTWGTATSTNATASINTSTGLLTISGLVADSVKVKVRARYNNQYYYAEFTANKTNQDKYDIIVKPNAIAYNSSEAWTKKTIDISSEGIDAQGNKLIPAISTDNTYAAGQFRVFWGYVKTDGKIYRPSATTTEGVDDLKATSKVVNQMEADNYIGIYFELRCYTSSSAYRLCDYETVEIAKTANGAPAEKIDYPTVYQASVTQPSTPTGSTVPPTGWSKTPPTAYRKFENADGNHQGWRIARGKSTAGTFIKERLSLNVAFATSISIEIEASCESSSGSSYYDFIAVGNVDTAINSRSDAASLSTSNKVQGTEKKTVTLSLTAGTHFIDIVYTKDSSGNYNLDCGWYRFTTPSGVDITVMPNRVWYSMAKLVDDELDGTWSTPAPWDSLDGLSGSNGESGDDGWMISADPANVIITQALGNDTTQFSSVMVGFTAKKGSAAATVSSIGAPSSSEFNVAKGTGDNVKKVVVSSPRTYTPSGGTAQYYTEGTFEVVVNVTDPDTNSNVAFSVTVPCYANLLGDWKRSVEGGVETIVANKVTYSYINGVLTKDGRDYDSIRDATISNETWRSQKESTYNGYAQQITDTNKRVNDAETSVQTLTHEVDGVVTDMTEVKQTSKEVSMSVLGDGFVNIFKNPYFRDTADEPISDWSTHNGTTVLVDTDTYLLRKTAVRAGSATSKTEILKQNVGLRLTASEYHTVSFYARHNGVINVSRSTNSTSGTVYMYLRVMKGKTYTLRVYGYLSISGRTLNLSVVNYSSSETMASSSLSGTSETYTDLTFTPTVDGIVYLKFAVSASSTGYITKVEINKETLRITLPNIKTSQEKMYVDGVEMNAATVAYVSVESMSEWERHIITYKTTETIASADFIIDTFSSAIAQTDFYYPRLEVGLTAHEGDVKGLKRTGIDITAGTIDMQADNFTLRNNNGDVSMGVDADGNAQFAGTIKAANIFHTVWMEGDNDTTLYYAKFTPSASDLYPDHPWPYVQGKYYAPSELDSEYGIGDKYGTQCLFPCTGNADIIIIKHATNDTDAKTIILPNAADYDGKFVEIIDTRYTQPNSQYYVGRLRVEEVDGASKMRYNYQDQDYVQLTLNGTTDHNGRNIRLIAYNGYWVWLRQTDIPQ